MPAMVGLGFIIGLLPLFNARYWFIAGSLMAVGLFRRRMLEEKRLLAGLLGPTITVFVITVTLNFLVYGLALPNAGYVYIMRGVNPAIYTKAAGVPFTRAFYVGVVGIIFDKHWGLMATAPIGFLALAGFGALWKRHKNLCIQIIVISGFYFAAVSGSTLWRGGPTPTPRFLVPVIPLLAFPLAAVYEGQISKKLRITTLMLMTIGLCTALASVTSVDADYIPSRLVATMRDAYGFSIASVLPSFDQRTSETLWLTSIWLIILVGIAWQVSRTTGMQKEHDLKQ